LDREFEGEEECDKALSFRALLRSEEKPLDLLLYEIQRGLSTEEQIRRTRDKFTEQFREGRMDMRYGQFPTASGFSIDALEIMRFLEAHPAKLQSTVREIIPTLLSSRSAHSETKVRISVAEAIELLYQVELSALEELVFQMISFCR
jgi:hypothetical protein